MWKETTLVSKGTTDNQTNGIRVSFYKKHAYKKSILGLYENKSITQSQMNIIKKGMSINEVIDILGKPVGYVYENELKTHSNNLNLIYKWNNNYVTIFSKNNKVTNLQSNYK